MYGENDSIDVTKLLINQGAYVTQDDLKIAVKRVVQRLLVYCLSVLAWNYRMHLKNYH